MELDGHARRPQVGHRIGVDVGGGQERVEVPQVAEAVGRGPGELAGRGGHEAPRRGGDDGGLHGRVVILDARQATREGRGAGAQHADVGPEAAHGVDRGGAEHGQGVGLDDAAGNADDGTGGAGEVGGGPRRQAQDPDPPADELLGHQVAGGAVVDLLESNRNNNYVKEAGMDKEIESKFDELKASLIEALSSKLEAAIATIQEGKAEEPTEDASVDVDSVLEAGRKIAESGLPEAAIVRVREAVKAGANVDSALESERAYLKEAMAATATPVDDKPVNTFKKIGW